MQIQDRRERKKRQGRAHVIWAAYEMLSRLEGAIGDDVRCGEFIESVLLHKCEELIAHDHAHCGMVIWQPSHLLDVAKTLRTALKKK